MGKWLRVDACFRDHPKAIRAGFWGALAAQAAWEVAKKFDLAGGDVTPHWEVELLADHLRLRDHLDLLEAGMAAAIKHGLVDEVDGRYVVHDWADHQRDISTERTRMWRQRKKRTQANGEETEARFNGTGHDVTGRDMTGHDTSRSGNGDEGGGGARGVEEDAKAMEASRSSVPCLQCGQPWRLMHGRDGDFYGHGAARHHLGCNATCPVDEYQPLAAKVEPKLCSCCGRYACDEGSELCAPCKAELARGRRAP